MSTDTAAQWGRVAEDGTVYVRTADGERAVGSWQAGTPEQGLAFYARRYADLAIEVGLLERRLEGGAGDPAAVAATARRLRTSLPTANVVGDLDALDSRLAAVEESAGGRQEEARAARREQAEQAASRKQALAEEAERLAETAGATGAQWTGAQWKEAGDRLRAIGDEWRGIVGADKAVDRRLWFRFAGARDEFGRWRGAHFAELDAQRETARTRKESLVAEAEGLAGSTDWGPTSNRLKALMTEWKAAGRAKRGDDDVLWERFRAAQDAFFAARTADALERDAELRENVVAKEAALVEAEAIDPSTDPDAALRRLRDVQARYDDAGRVPRELAPELERRMCAVEERVRRAQEARWARRSESPFLVRLREAVAGLEAKLDKARAAGARADQIEAQLATQRAWLAQAQGGEGGGRG
ncbi:MAG: DUF349 domain-containing protein [Actinomycetota bacterium]|nr:DUF349 domain-containing protein [Actinomycetota bacterium]